MFAQFLPDHPGGEKAIILYAGRDATEEFNMLHDPKVWLTIYHDAYVQPRNSFQFLGHSTIRTRRCYW